MSTAVAVLLASLLSQAPQIQPTAPLAPTDDQRTPAVTPPSSPPTSPPTPSTEATAGVGRLEVGPPPPAPEMPRAGASVPVDPTLSVPSSTAAGAEEPASVPAPPARAAPHETARERALRLSRVPQYPRLQRLEVWLPATAGILVACGSGYLFSQARHDSEVFNSSTSLRDLDEIRALAQRGTAYQTWGWIGLGTTAALFGVAAWGVLHPDRPPGPSLSFQPIADGAALAWSGSF